LKKGSNDVKVIAKKGKSIVEDAISFQYQTEKWGKPAKLLIEKIKEQNDTVTIQAKLLDDKNVQCLDSANWIRFGLAGDGKLIDNQGTSSGSRYVQLYNGRAVIRVKMNKGRSVMSAKVEDIATTFINL
jgi:beta-galactosidase